MSNAISSSHYQLVSLYNMLRFHAEKFVTLMLLLGHRRMFAIREDTEIEDENLLTAQQFFRDLDEQCIDLELDISVLHAERILTKIKRGHVTYGSLSVDIEWLCTLVGDELGRKVFMHLPNEKSKFFTDARALFGKSILEAFPSVITEVEEAGKCYAAGRNTATVFHLMRIMEAALKVIATQLSISTDTNRSWDSILKKIKDAVEQQHSRDEWTDFYAGLHARLYAVKDAWRNPTMHIDRSYGEEEALDIFNNVSSFMRHLSTRLSE